jgi:sec-independent protein translocase protein TatB
VLAIFNSLGGGEVIAILVIGLIVLGPEKLPDAIRKFGNIYGELRRMSQGFQSELRDAFDEPMQSIRGTAQMMQDAVNEPLESITRMAPIAGGGQKDEPADDAGSADGVDPAEEPGLVEGAGPVEEEAQAPVDDTPAAGQPAPGLDASTDDDEAPAGSAAAAWMGEQANGRSAQVEVPTEQANGTVPAPATKGGRSNGTEPGAGSPSDGDDEEPILAEAGLLVSEPEMPSDELEDEERPA